MTRVSSERTIPSRAEGAGRGHRLFMVRGVRGTRGPGRCRAWVWGCKRDAGLACRGAGLGCRSCERGAERGNRACKVVQEARECEEDLERIQGDAEGYAEDVGEGRNSARVRKGVRRDSGRCREDLEQMQEGYRALQENSGDAGGAARTGGYRRGEGRIWGVTGTR